MRGWWRFVTLSLMTGWLTAPCLMGYAQNNDTEKPGISNQFAGPQSCGMCHSPRVNADDSEFRSNDDFVLLNEAVIWSTEDKHREAFAVLVGSERIARMETLLGWQPGQAARDKRCLSCHVGLPLDALPAESKDNPHVIAQELLADIRIREGVSCEICHGASVGNATALNAADPMSSWWYDAHANRRAVEDPEWRYLSPEEKRKVGFIDVRTPSAQARLCLSCHIGDAEQGRVLTHDMYAAGHPPLPSFELVTFSHQEPSHWRRPQAKKVFEALDAGFKKRTGKAILDRPDQLYETKLLLINALVSQQQSWKLMAAMTQPPQSSDSETLTVPADASPHWPELSVMECYQCHHDLHEPSWRQQRPANPKTPVGRPGQREWPRILAQLAAQALGLAQDKASAESIKRWSEITAEIDAAMLSRPFGHRERLHTACTEGITVLEELIQQTELATWQADAAPQLLQQLEANHLHGPWEYDSARQVAWAAQVVSSEMIRLKTLEKDAQSPLILPFTGNDIAWLSLPSRSGIDTVMRRVDIMGERRKDFQVHDIDLSKTLPRILDYEIQNGKRAK